MNKKVALFVSNLRGGGAERVIVILANSFHKLGYDVDLILVQAIGPYLKEVHDGVNVISLNKSKNIFSLFPFIKYLKKERPYVVLSTLLQVSIITVLARKLSGVKTKVVLRETINVSADAQFNKNKSEQFIGLFRKWAIKNADKIVAPSIGVGEDLKTRYNLEDAKVNVVFNPLEINRMIENSSFSTPLLEEIDETIPILLAVGRLSWQKNFDVLIQAFEKVSKSTRACLIILGEGEERKVLENMIKAKGLKDRVFMPGFMENPFPYFKRAAVFILSSRYEGMPNALIQAMVFQTQIVSTDCPSGPREILEGGKYGCLVGVGDVNSIAVGIEKGLNQELLTPSHDLIIERFESRSIAQKYLQILIHL